MDLVAKPTANRNVILIYMFVRVSLKAYTITVAWNRQLNRESQLFVWLIYL